MADAMKPCPQRETRCTAEADPVDQGTGDQGRVGVGRRPEEWCCHGEPIGNKWILTMVN